MKIFITGHTRGLGESLYNIFKDEHDCVGISKSTGHHVGKKQSEIIQEAQDCDLFINNAEYKFAQVQLFERLAAVWWDDPTKTILNINSWTRLTKLNDPEVFAKKELHKRASRLTDERGPRKCRVINITPGHIKTSDSSSQPKLEMNEVVQAVQWCISLPQHIEVSDIYIRAISDK